MYGFVIQQDLLWETRLHPQTLVAGIEMLCVAVDSISLRVQALNVCVVSHST